MVYLHNFPAPHNDHVRTSAGVPALFRVAKISIKGGRGHVPFSMQLPTASLKLLQGKEPHVTRKPNAVQYSRDPKDYQNVDGSSRLQQLNSTL